MEDDFLEKFRQCPGEARPEWALKPDDTGSLSASLEAVPLFMTEMPHPSDIESNTTIQALQSLLYDYETPDEVSQNFRKQGNEAFREGRWKDGAGFYGQGIAVKGVGARIKSVLYGNRAAAFVQLGKWTDALNDCKSALNLAGNDSSNNKVVERGIKCALKLRDFEFIRRYMNNISDEALRAEANGLLSYKEPNTRDVLREYLQRKLSIAFKEHSEDKILALLPTVDSSSIPSVHLENGRSVWPVIVFYPEHAQSDFIEGFSEEDTFNEHLKRLFEVRPEWDCAEIYNCQNLSLFIVNSDDELVCIDKRMKLANIFPNIINRYDKGIIGLYAIPKNRQKIIAEFTNRFVRAQETRLKG